MIAAAMLLLAAPAIAKKGGKEPTLRAAKYPGTTTFQCRTGAIPIHPGQNLNDFGATKTCPNAVKVSGPGSVSDFSPGSTKQGYITRFKPSMVEVKPNGRLVTPAVWDLHLHHVVWIAPGFGPVFAAGEEKTIAKLPKGYGLKIGGDANWTINQMIHNLTASDNRQVYITWMIDWVPEAAAEAAGIEEANVRWLDVAGLPQIYPVFDAKKNFDLNDDGRYVFPDEVPTDPSAPGYSEREKISNSRMWKVPAGGATLLFGAGHLHPGGKNVNLEVSRDGPDPGSVGGDGPGETRRLFRSRAKYYEPAGAVSWDVSIRATSRKWRISLKEGDTVSINVIYDVSKASWYESMGIMPLAWTAAEDPKAKDPFDDAAAVKAMYKDKGTLTHGRLRENIDRKARKNLKLPDPRKLRPQKRPLANSGIDIRSFVYDRGGFSANRGFPRRLMRPPLVERGTRVQFNNFDALSTMPQTEQAWHSITSCKAPCNRGSGIGYPLADGPLNFDSGQLGFGRGTSKGVTTGTSTYKTPKLKKPGKTYTYFCRIHPFMRGSIRVKGKRKGAKKKVAEAAIASGAFGQS
jgi:plastocyanin